jgi:putative redox protein
MPEELIAHVTLKNQKVHFIGKTKTNLPIDIDYHPPVGDGEGYTSLELLLLSLASCSGTSIIALLRKMKKDVSDFAVESRGIRREQHPTSFEKIYLKFSLTSKDAANSDVEKALSLSEESYCPVWAMLKGNAEIIPEYTISRQ